jgi:hypothetical protein
MPLALRRAARRAAFARRAQVGACLHVSRAVIAAMTRVGEWHTGCCTGC